MSAQQVPMEFTYPPSLRVAWDLWAQLAAELPAELAYTKDELELIMLRPVPPGWSGGRIAWRWAHPEWALVAGDVIAQRGLNSDRVGRWEVRSSGCICCYKGMPHHHRGGGVSSPPGWKIERPGCGVRIVGRPWLRGSNSRVDLVRPGALPTPGEVREWADHGLMEWHGPTAVVDACQGVW